MIEKKYNLLYIINIFTLLQFFIGVWNFVCSTSDCPLGELQTAARANFKLLHGLFSLYIQTV